MHEGEPYFVGKDVASALGYAAPRNAIAAHCRGALTQCVPTSSGVQEMSIIPERDVYRLIMRSKLPAAEAFEEWVVGVVLPAIRRGLLSVSAPASLIFSYDCNAEEHHDR